MGSTFSAPIGWFDVLRSRANYVSKTQELESYRLGYRRTYLWTSYHANPMQRAPQDRQPSRYNDKVESTWCLQDYHPSCGPKSVVWQRGEQQIPYRTQDNA